MTVRVPVVTDLPGYRVAAAGLPLRAKHAEAPERAIVVVDGRTAWWDAAAGAIDAGASVVLVAEPCEVPVEAIGDLVEQGGVPIIVQRSRLREDLVAMAMEHREGARPHVIVAECRATAAELPAMIRDAVGWMRAVSGVELVVATASVRPMGGTALIRARDGGGIVGSMSLAVTRPEGTLLRVQALGETTTEVEVDPPAGRSELATSTIRGRLVAPSRFETPERTSLRRAIDAVVLRHPSSDLADLRHDASAASLITTQLDRNNRSFS